MINLDNGTVERWLGSAEEFSYDFIRYLHLYMHAIGVHADFVRAEVEDAHREWATICNHWQTHLFEQDVESLSYTKIFSVLLFCLSKRTFIENLSTYVNAGRRSDPVFNGTDIEQQEARDDFLGAPEAIASFDFCINIMNFYEERRIDREDPFQPKLTEAMRHDMIYFLGSPPADALAVYMALKAIYTRD
jgi:hypothetical protein